MGFQQPDPPHGLRPESLPSHSTSGHVSGLCWPSSQPSRTELGDQLTSLGWSILGLEEEGGGQRVGREQAEAEMFQQGPGVGEAGKQVGKGQRGEWGRLKCLLLQNLQEWQSESFPAHLDIQQMFVHSESEVGFFLTSGHGDGGGCLLSAAGVVSCNRLKYRFWSLTNPGFTSQVYHALNLWVKVSQLYPTLCDPMDYIVHRILQARILEQVAFPFSRGSSQPGDWTQVSRIAGDSLPAEPQGKP